ncbi:MAG: hypothetical protein GY725_13780 [bacterium]|nr:hypothetical protein [bacterium]
MRTTRPSQLTQRNRRTPGAKTISHLVPLLIVACFAFWLPRDASASDEFEHGFKHELGRIAAHEAVGIGRALIGAIFGHGSHEHRGSHGHEDSHCEHDHHACSHCDHHHYGGRHHGHAGRYYGSVRYRHEHSRSHTSRGRHWD